MAEKYEQGGILQNILSFISKILMLLWLIFFLSICLTSIILVTRPSFLWRHFVDAVNGNKFIIHQPVDVSIAQEVVNSQFDAEGKIIVSEDIMTSLTRSYLSTYLPNSTIDIEENKILIYWTLVSDGERNDLIGSIEIKSEGEVFEFTDFAVGRFSVPEFIRAFIEERVFAAIGINQPIDIHLVLQSMDLDSKRFDIKTLKLENNSLIVEMKTNNSIFNTNSNKND